MCMFSIALVPLDENEKYAWRVWFDILDFFFLFTVGFFSFNTSTIFEASPFHFSVLETYFSQLAPRYSSPMFPGVCGLTLKQK